MSARLHSTTFPLFLETVPGNLRRRRVRTRRRRKLPGTVSKNKGNVVEWSLADIRCFVRARSSFAVRGVIGTAGLSAFAADHFGRSEILVRHVRGNDVDRDAVIRVSV